MASEVNWLSSAIGPFIGAMLAFGTNRYIEREKRFQEELVAANLALITLKNQYNDFLLFRKGFREDIALCAIKGTEPVWMLIRPSFLQLGDYAVDFTSIGFLLNTVEGKEVFDKLELVQIFHRDLKSLLELANEQARLKQQKYATVHAEKTDATADELKSSVGLDVVSNLTAIGIALAVRSEKNEKVYVDAFNSLRKMLCEHFNSYSEWKFCRCGLPWYCNKSCDDQLVAMKVPSKGFAYSELCSLPKSLDDAIKLIPPASDEVAI